MMISKNGAGLLVFVLSTIGLTISETQAVELIAAISNIASFALLAWNQASRPDVKNFLFKK